MGQQIFANNASTTLAAPMNSVQTTMQLASAVLFPVIAPGSGNWFVVTLQRIVSDLVTAQEIVKVTGTLGVIFTIVRNWEGTVAQPWSIGDTIAHFPTAGTDANFLQLWNATTAEISAGVTPTNLRVQTGPVRYGAAGNGVTNDQPAWATMAQVSDRQFIQEGIYLLNTGIVVNADVDWEGAGVTGSQIKGSSGVTGYGIEIGSNSGSPNVSGGMVEKLYFSGFTSACQAILALSPGATVGTYGANLWTLRDLMFFYNACQALLLNGNEDCWFDNITVYGGPATGAAIAIGGAANNLYFIELHLEQCLAGAMSIATQCGPIHVAHGKLDQGFRTQTAAGFTIAQFGELFVNDFECAGAGNGFPYFSVAGTLGLSGKVQLGGGGSAALIQDIRQWVHIDSTSYPTINSGAYGPYIGLLDLGDSQCLRTNDSEPGSTFALVNSKIPGYLQVNNLSITSTGSAGGATYTCTSNYTAAAANTLVGSFLVYNPQGTTTGVGNQYSRRLIVANSTGANSVLTLLGAWAPATGTDCSVEYCAGHYTPNFRAQDVALDNQQTLFQVMQSGATISGPFYTASSAAGGINGTTAFAITAANFPAGTDATGFYLVDEVTGEAFLIAYGVDGSGNMGVPYNRTASLNASHTYSIVAGYFANAQINGQSLEWTFAGKKKTALISALKQAGFDTYNIPIWGFAQTGEPVNLPYSASISLDASQTHQPIITATNSTPFTMQIPSNLCNGDLIEITIKNSSGGALGAITWNAVFKMAAWVSPANNFQASIAFRYDGINLIERYRSLTTIPV